MKKKEKEKEKKDTLPPNVISTFFGELVFLLMVSVLTK